MDHICTKKSRDNSGNGSYMYILESFGQILTDFNKIWYATIFWCALSIYEVRIEKFEMAD